MVDQAHAVTPADVPDTSDTDTGPSRRAMLGLDALNLFLADVRDGLGPYLAIYLIAVRGPDQGWNEATVGGVMTIAGLVGLLAQTPAGAFIDDSRNKPAIVIGAALAVTLSCLALPLISNFYLVAGTQSLAAIAGAIFPPALSGITLGLVGVGAGIYGALLPVVVADITYGTGRFNVSQGAIATARGLGAAFSASLAGVTIVWAGYPAAFLTLAAIAAIGFILYAPRMPETRRPEPRRDT